MTGYLKQTKKESLAISHSQFLSLVYHDLFDYPLTKDELWYWQIGESQEPKHIVGRLGKTLFLEGKEKNILKRLAKARASKKKIAIARRAAGILALLPTVKMVGVSGGLSMNNAAEDDDIDLVIITAVDTLWITRLLSFVLLWAAGLKLRRFGEKELADKLCLNMWITQGSLGFAPRYDVYTAHEIVQIKALKDKERAYQRFLTENAWVRSFFPNAFDVSFKLSQRTSTKGDALISRVINYALQNLLRLFDLPAYLLQSRYMAGKKTKEMVERGRAMFHPLPWNKTVPEMFFSRLERMAQGKLSPHRLYSQITD